MTSDLAGIILLFGRVLLGGAFVVAGLRNLGSIPVLTQLVGERGVPLPRLVLLAGIFVQLVAGGAVMAGLWPLLAGPALIAFIVLATLMFDNFWDHEGLERVNRINGFISNTALVGGFLVLMVAG